MTTAELQLALEAGAERICQGMRKKLTDGGHIDTGALIGSIRHETEVEGDTVTVYIKADAENPSNSAQYAEFLELGTGAAHGRPGGRVGSWRYKDRHGVWHTTDGMDPDPFIRPSFAEQIGSIREEVKDAVRHEFDLEKYRILKGG